jgi:hypothetical protein
MGNDLSALNLVVGTKYYTISLPNWNNLLSDAQNIR